MPVEENGTRFEFKGSRGVQELPFKVCRRLDVVPDIKDLKEANYSDSHLGRPGR